MLGNVSEWCFNVYVRDFAAETDDALNRRVIDRQSMVERGGGYSTSVRTIRSANRRYNLPSNSSFSIGFRIARTLEAKPRPR
jgi:formylglycine-generating enzyme required for sulfatase activity